ncbi:heat shock protein 30 [Lasiosphaeria ovina]|uniref:Heat shock protein 30 n=1 Tax=Lasiosphaeria ovina TaxID=92902 RepID=A0AAE0N4Y5_9PEZI|nr:heat shock protein 30 [Lasiosphaeria ovina]
MMSFLSSPLYSAPSEPTFTPLFRLLNDFDTYSREVQGDQQGSAASGRRSKVATFKPKFDVRETEKTYELHGELPGIERENLTIEFTDPQTIVVRGRVERTYENKPEEHAGANTTDDHDNHSVTSHKATVEDDPEESHSATSPETQVAKTAGAEVQKAAPNHKYWVYERSIGEFSRTFSFPGRVDQEAVSAGLNNGILTVSVPKAKKHEARRIAIN